MLLKFFKKGVGLLLFCALVSSGMTVYAEGKTEITLTKLQGVPAISQYPQLPTGCEATALTMLLNYSGLMVSKQNVADALPKVSLPYYSQGKKVGSHPSQGFIGNPYSKHSYGVFAEPILKVIEHYLPGRSEDLRGKSIDELLEIVKEGRPVMIWATMSMVNVSYTQSWQLQTGETFWWPNNEHALVIVGYDDKWIYMNDPQKGIERKFSRAVVNNRYYTLGKQAVAILPESIPLKLQVNEENISLEGNRTILMKQDKVLVPLCYLDEIGIRTQYSYINNVCEWQIPQLKNTIQIKAGTGMGVGYLEDGTKIKIEYELEKGITRVNLKDLLPLHTFTYDVKEDVLEIKVP